VFEGDAKSIQKHLELDGKQLPIADVFVS